MNNLHRVENIFINNGAPLPAPGATITAITPGVVGVFGQSMVEVAATPNITAEPKLTVFEALPSGMIKKSMVIDATSVLKYEAERYQAAKSEVWAVGFNRAIGAGQIEVANDTDYSLTIGFKHDKELFSERNADFRITFVSPAAATQLGIATTIASKINQQLTKYVKAIVVGDGTGVLGLTGATKYGVEITGLEIPQFADTSYRVVRPYFGVFVDDSTGFGQTTTCAKIQAMDLGVGTYAQISQLESFDYQYEGVINRRAFPIPVLEKLASPVLNASAAVTASTAATVIGDDVLLVGSTTDIKGGDIIEVGGVQLTVKYIINATSLVVTVPFTSVIAAGPVVVKLGYSVMSIEFNDQINTPTGVVAVANKSIKIAFPTIDAGQGVLGLSAFGTSIKALFDSWMLSTPRAFAAVII